MESVNDDCIKALMKDAAKRLNCEVEDLEWRCDKFGAIHIRIKHDEGTVDSSA